MADTTIRCCEFSTCVTHLGSAATGLMQHLAHESTGPPYWKQEDGAAKRSLSTGEISASDTQFPVLVGLLA